MEDLFKSFAEELEARKLAKGDVIDINSKKNAATARADMIDDHMDNHMNSTMDGGPSDDPAHAKRQKEWDSEYNTQHKKFSAMSDSQLKSYRR